MPATPSQLRLGAFLGFIGVVIFGGTLPMTRLAVMGLDPWFVTMGRATVAGVLALVAIAVLRPPLPRKQDWPIMALASLGLVIGFPGFAGFAMQSVPSAHGGVVFGVMPLATAVAATVVAGERPSPAFWMIAAIGAAIVATFALRNGGTEVVTGDFWLLAGGACAAFGYAWSGMLSRTMPGWAVISWALVIAMPLTVPASVFLLPASLETVPTTSWLAFGYLSVFSMFVGFFAWNAGLALGGIARVGQVQLLQTFVTLAVAAFVLGEKVDAETLAYAVAVVAVVAAGRFARVSAKA